MKQLSILAMLLLAFAVAGCGEKGEPISPAPAPGPTSSVGVRPGTDGVPAVPPGYHPPQAGTRSQAGTRPTGP